MEVINELNREQNFEKIMKDIMTEKNKLMIKLDELEPSFICMHTNERFFSVLSSKIDCKIIEDSNKYFIEYKKKYPNIKVSFMKNLQELEKLDTNNKNELCEELLKIIIDENLQGDGDYKKIKEHLKKNFEDFLFTKDNFINMVMLYLRIRAGIPTILMGETGCGKTYLVKMFSLLF